jgi:glutamyl-Q tRNA(Asp) synthetase
MNRARLQPAFRFAPSPNGYLHLGHAYSALLNQALARRHGGRFILRIEDIDVTRCRPEFEQAIYEDLAWLGLAWEEPVLRQSEHFPRYRAVLERWRREDLVYPCICSRQDIARAVARREAETGRPWPRDPDGAALYPGTCRDRPVAADAPAALRLRAEAWRAPDDLGWREHALPDFTPGAWHGAADYAWGDAVLGRKEVPASYHLAVVLDDAAQNISHVVRGKDLLAATALHRRLQARLGLAPPLYAHHDLIRDPAGAKLAKSTGATRLRALRRDGATVEDVLRLAGIPAAW